MRAFVKSLDVILRQLRRDPGLSLIVVLSLALGIGSTTAIFSLVEGILLKPLDFKNSAQLVVLGDHVGEGEGISVTAREIGTYSTATTAFASVGGFTTASYEVTGGSVAEEFAAARLTWGVFPTLGIEPIFGRLFTAQEESSRLPVAVISDSMWRDRYQRSPDVLGRIIALDRSPYTIIGVMPASFEFPAQGGLLNQTKLWVPMSLTPEELSEGHAGYWGYQMIARLKDGISVTTAQQDVERVARIIKKDFPPAVSSIPIRGAVSSLMEDTVGGVRSTLRTFFGAVSVVLLIAGVNVAALLTVRAIRRRQEYALRLALGARLGAIFRAAAFEGVALSMAGGLLGLGFASIVIRTALHFLPDFMPRLNSVSMDGRVVGFALVAAVTTGVLCSVAPTFAAAQTHPMASLNDGGRLGGGSLSHPWLRSTLIIAEIAVAFVLITAAGAFLRSFLKMRAVDPGFRPDHVLSASYRLPLNQYPTESAAANFNRTILDHIGSGVGISAVGITSSLPASGFVPETAYTLEGTPATNWKLDLAAYAITDGKYFQALGIPLIDGRFFSQEDRPNSPLVIIVNQSMARHCWPEQRAVGKRLHVGSPQHKLPLATVVGVVADTRLGSRDEESIDQWYAPASQPATLNGNDYDGKLSDAARGYIAVRSPLSSEQVTHLLRNAVAEADPLLALDNVQTMYAAMTSAEASRRFNTSLISVFAAAALLLAVTGIYAVVAFSVSLRSQEIAIRVALGAQHTNIANLVLLYGARMAFIGSVLGVLGSLAASRVINSFLFGVSATDPWAFGLAVLCMMVTALLASSLPAMRAVRVDPISALKSN